MPLPMRSSVTGPCLVRSACSLAGRAACEEMRKKRNGPARRTLVLAALRRRARDIEVHPRIALGEPRKEARRGDRAVAARADVREIRDLRLERILILVPHRHVPAAVPCA